MRTRKITLAIGAVLALVSACGSDDGGGAPTTSPLAGTTAPAGADATAADTTLAAAADTTSPETSVSTSVATPAVDRGAELKIGINYGFNSLDPHRSIGGDEVWLKPVYDTLLHIEDSPDGAQLGPQLATSFEVADDGLTVTFTLREGVMFQDGTPFDAAAVQANIERAKSPDSRVVSLLATIASVDVVDDTHVAFHLTEPDAGVPWAMALNATGSMVSPAAFATDISAKPVGTGPFTLVSAQQGADAVYERWDGYWDPDAALVKKLVISTVADANARLNGLRSGTYDAAFISQPEQAKELEAEGYHYVDGLVPGPFAVLLNSAMPPFDDVRVRRAVSMAIDRKAISEHLLGGVAPPVYQPFSKILPGYDPALDVDPYNPEEAKQLIEEAGATGAKVTLLQVQTPPLDAMCEVVQQALTDVGLAVELAPLDFASARTRWVEGGDQAFVIGMRSGYVPSVALANAFLGGDNPAPPPEDLVAMAASAKALPYGSDEQKQAYQEIDRWLVENPIHVPIAATVHIVVARPNVVGAENLFTYSVSRLDPRGVGIQD
jgi:peptide/nickel transport system substrate-binding protein